MAVVQKAKGPLIAALQRNEKGHPISIRFSRIKNFCQEQILRCGQSHINPQSIVVSYGLAYFNGFNPFRHFHFSVKTTG